MQFHQVLFNIIETATTEYQTLLSQATYSEVQGTETDRVRLKADRGLKHRKQTHSGWQMKFYWKNKNEANGNPGQMGGQQQDSSLNVQWSNPISLTTSGAILVM